MINLIEKISDFLSLQLILLSAFMKMFPNCKDHKFLLDFPKNGIVSVDGTDWKFIKHGAGLLFISEANGTEVDARRAIDLPDTFDLNRIEQYLETTGYDFESLEDEIAVEIDKGNVVVVDKDYRLMKLAS